MFLKYVHIQLIKTKRLFNKMVLCLEDCRDSALETNECSQQFILCHHVYDENLQIVVSIVKQLVGFFFDDAL